MAGRGAHAERVPVVVDDHARRRTRGSSRSRTVRGRRRRRVRDGGVEHVRRRRHRAEDLAARDGPARLGPPRRRRRAGQVLSWLADGRAEDRPLARHLLHRRAEGRGAALVPEPPAVCQRRTTLSTKTRCMLTPIVSAASPRARRLDATTTSWSDVTPSPPSSSGIGAARNPLRLIAARLSCGKLASRSWRAARPATSSASTSASATRRRPGSDSGYQLERHLRFLSDVGPNER